jgi:rsbT co-antagonist protein RsbR
MFRAREPDWFEVRRPDAWDSSADSWKLALETNDYSVSREIEQKIVLVQQQETISELTTPVMEIWNDVLVLPIVGVVDTRRSVLLMNNLLDSIVRTQSRCVIIDVTGVEIVDTSTADYLLRVIRAASLLGSRGVLTGLSSAVAQTLVEIGADLSSIRIFRSIKDGLKDRLALLERETR